MYRGNFTFPFILYKGEVQINVARSNILTVTNIIWDLMLYTLVEFHLHVIFFLPNYKVLHPRR